MKVLIPLDGFPITIERTAEGYIVRYGQECTEGGYITAATALGYSIMHALHAEGKFDG